LGVVGPASGRADHHVGIGVIRRVVVGYDVMVGVRQRSEPRDDTPNGVKFAPEATLRVSDSPA